MTVYMLMIQYDPSVPHDGSPSRQPEHARLTEVMRTRGHHLSGAGLVPQGASTRRVHHQRGEVVLTGGPFVETREALGGYYVVDCSEAEAMDYARVIPVDSRSWIEVRRVGVYEGD